MAEMSPVHVYALLEPSKDLLSVRGSNIQEINSAPIFVVGDLK
jgi:hypothetical protein